jgi:hypothetical protein
MGQRLQWIAGLIAGLGLAALGYAAFQYAELKKFRREYELAQGVVSEVVTADSVHFYPRIRFKTLDNQRLHLKLRREEANVKPGDSLAIYYDLVNPADAHLAMHHSERPIWWWGGAGVALLLPALAGLGWLLGLGWRARRLVASGRRVQVELLRAEPVRAWAFTGLHPHRLVCAWTDPTAPAKPLILESGMFFGAPNVAEIKDRLFAYLAPDGSGAYHIDLSVLPASRRLV